MHDYNYYLRLVDGAINNIQYPKNPSKLYEPIAYTMNQGGKRVRPVLTLMTCEAMGGNLDDAINVALGIELFHNFTLLHDDVMDRADIRRGQPTVHTRWNENVAILSGDTMLNMAAQAISKVDDDILPAMVKLFNDTAIKVYEGQQYDMDFEKRNDVTVEEYINMIRLKTSVLLGCACKAGALVARTDEENAESIYNMAVNLGLKKTFLLINAIDRSAGNDAIELNRWLADTSSPKQEKIQAVTALYEKLGLKDLARNAIVNYSHNALDLLHETKMSYDAYKVFDGIINRLVDRDR